MCARHKSRVSVGDFRGAQLISDALIEGAETPGMPDCSATKSYNDVITSANEIPTGKHMYGRPQKAFYGCCY